MIVLILEDDPTMMETLEKRLPWQRMGFERVLTAQSMPEGQRLISENGADFLLLDVEVIRGTGIELLRWAREHGCDAECVFLTNHAEFGYAKEAVRLGSIDYVLKTEPLSAVENAVRRALSRIRPDALFDAARGEREAAYEAPDATRDHAEKWARMLENDQRAALLDDIRGYLSQREEIGKNSAGLRMVLQHDFTQIVYKLLERYDIQASAMFACEEDTVSYRNAPNSAFDTLKWLGRFIGRADSLLADARKRETVAGRARAYIEEHYAEALNRQTLAERLFVNPDHLSHLFSKEYGLSLPDFLARTRMEAAKRLLKSGASVSEAATRVGYDNFAYFSTVFKRLTGVSPSDFRKDYGG